MSGVIGGGVTLRGVNDSNDGITWNLAASVTKADLDAPMSIDTSSNATLKKAADGEVVYAPLSTFEDREVEGIKTGTAYTKGFFTFPYSGTLAVGDSIVADGTGKVKKATGANNSKVFEKDTPAVGFVTVRISN